MGFHHQGEPAAVPRPGHLHLMDPVLATPGPRHLGHQFTAVHRKSSDAVRQADKFSGRSSERSWLCGILKNKIRDYFRRLGRETNFSDLEFFNDESSDRFDGEHYWIHERGPANWKHEGEEAVKRAEFWEAVQACLDRLQPRVAQVFIMREMDDIPSKEVCEMLNISQANLWVMLHRARMALRQDLEKTFFGSNGGTKL